MRSGSARFTKPLNSTRESSTRSPFPQPHDRSLSGLGFRCHRGLVHLPRIFGQSSARWGFLSSRGFLRHHDKERASHDVRLLVVRTKKIQNLQTRLFQHPSHLANRINPMPPGMPLGLAVPHKGCFGFEATGVGQVTVFGSEKNLRHLPPPPFFKRRQDGFRRHPSVEGKPATRLQRARYGRKKGSHLPEIEIAEAVAETERAVEFRGVIHLAHVAVDELGGEAGGCGGFRGFADEIGGDVQARDATTAFGEFNRMTAVAARRVQEARLRAERPFEKIGLDARRFGGGTSFRRVV